jgi:hypothetical protein
MRAECREQVAKALGKRKLSAADSNRISSLRKMRKNPEFETFVSTLLDEIAK